MTRLEPPERLSPRAKAIFGRRYNRLALVGRWKPLYASGLAAYATAVAGYLDARDGVRAATSDEEAAIWRQIAAEARPIARALAAEYLAITAGRLHLAEVNEHGDDADLANLE